MNKGMEIMTAYISKWRTRFSKKNQERSKNLLLLSFMSIRFILRNQQCLVKTLFLNSLKVNPSRLVFYSIIKE